MSEPMTPVAANKSELLAASRFLRKVARANALLNAGRLREAFDALGDLKPTPGRTPEVIYLQAAIAMQLQDWSRAYELLAALVQAIPDRAIIHLDRATCLIALNRHDEARTILDMEEKHLRDRFPRYVLLARIARHEGHHQQAAASLQTALRLDAAGTRALAERHPELDGLLPPLGGPPATPAGTARPRYRLSRRPGNDRRA